MFTKISRTSPVVSNISHKKCIILAQYSTIYLNLGIIFLSKYKKLYNYISFLYNFTIWDKLSVNIDLDQYYYCAPFSPSEYILNMLLLEPSLHDQLIAAVNSATGTQLSKQEGQQMLGLTMQHLRNLSEVGESGFLRANTDNLKQL